MLLAALVHANEPNPCDGAKRTCNEDRTTCCRWWYIAVVTGGKESGGILEDSYPKLLATLESRRKTGQWLCRAGFVSDCLPKSYSAPRCSGMDSGAAKQVEDAAEKVTVSIALRQAQKKAAALQGFQQIVARFESIRRFEEAVRGGVGLDGKAAGALAVLTTPVRKAFAERHRALSEYTQGLLDVARRVGDLQEQVEVCARYFNPYLDKVIDDPARDLWTVMGGWGGHVEAARQDAARRDGVASIRTVVDEAPRLPEIRTVELPSETVVRSSLTSGHGRVVFGEQGTLREREHPSGGSFPLVFARLDGERLDLGEVQVDRHETPDGERIVVSGAYDGGREQIELLACTGGRRLAEGRCVCPGSSRWSGSACACPPPRHFTGADCTACPPGQVWSDGRCDCPAGLHSVERQCRACPGNSEWNGQSCECAAGLHLIADLCRPCAPTTMWNGSACVCAGGRQWNGSACACPPRSTWNGSSCSCAPPSFLTAKGCWSCPADTTWNGSLCMCRSGMQWDGRRCVAPVASFTPCDQVEPTHEKYTFDQMCRANYGARSTCKVFQTNVSVNSSEMRNTPLPTRVLYCWHSPWNDHPDTLWACCVP